jgi:antitoxin (DNA-binding transcriptional repressor) of toxin-antitoxin stability system
MKRASITQTKNGLSALIDGLKGGEAVLTVDRGRPVARLEPVVAHEEGAHSGRLARLIRDGVLRPRLSIAPAAVFNTPRRAPMGRPSPRSLGIAGGVRFSPGPSRA